MFCSNCGAEVNDKAVVCVKCGCAINRPAPAVNLNEGTRDWLVTLLLCFFVGCFGIHRFYVGCGIWTLIDFIMIALGNFTDADGNYIKNTK